MKFRSLIVIGITVATTNLCLAQARMCRESLLKISYAQYLAHQQRSFQTPGLDVSQYDSLVTEFYKTNYQGRTFLIFADDEPDQSSGVATVMQILKNRIEKKTGLQVVYVTPKMFKSHVDIKFQGQVFHQALPTKKEILEIYDHYKPAAVHIMAELAVGNRARSALLKRGIPFTTAYHTEWPKFTSIRLQNIPGYRFIRSGLERLIYWYLRTFHGRSQGVMVPSKSLVEVLAENKFKRDNLRQWSHGVDLELFKPESNPGEPLDQSIYHELAAQQGRKVEGKIVVMVSRLGTEKNAEDFFKMKMPVPATKFFIGPGSEAEIAHFKTLYPDVIFLGRKNHDTELPALNRAADLFVFTGFYETYGLVMGEALASGTPVLAFDVQGPKDIITDSRAGVLVPFDMNDRQGNIRRLEENVEKALQLKRDEVRAFAETISWDKSVTEFLYYLQPLAP